MNAPVLAFYFQTNSTRATDAWQEQIIISSPGTGNVTIWCSNFVLSEAKFYFDIEASEVRDFIVDVYRKQISNLSFLQKKHYKGTGAKENINDLEDEYFA